MQYGADPNATSKEGVRLLAVSRLSALAHCCPRAGVCHGIGSGAGRLLPGDGTVEARRARGRRRQQRVLYNWLGRWCDCAVTFFALRQCRLVQRAEGQVGWQHRRHVVRHQRGPGHPHRAHRLG